MATHRRKGSYPPAGWISRRPPRLEELVWVRFRTTRQFDCARCYEPTSIGQWAYRVAHKREGGRPHSSMACGQYLCHWCGEKLAGKEAGLEPPRTR
jgi:hypothetical protein